MSASLSQNVVLKSSYSPFLMTFFIAILSATMAYFIPKRFTRTKTEWRCSAAIST